MRPSRDETWLRVAQEIARRSTCLRRNVGCVLVNVRGHVLSTGQNGVAAGQPHCNEPATKFSAAELITGEATTRVVYPYECLGVNLPSGMGLDQCQAIHAEANALLQCHDVWKIDTCYITHSPCVSCVKLLLNTSCTRVVFLEEYAHDETAQQLFLKGRPGYRWEKFTWPNGGI